MKGLILSGGRGTRLRPITFTRAKQLIPIANKPNLFYAIEDLVAAGITEIGVILSPETFGEFEALLGDGSGFGASFTLIPQDRPLGLAHAVKCARPFLADDPFVLYLGDNLVSSGIGSLVHSHGQDRDKTSLLLAEVQNPQAFGVAVLDGQGRVRRLVEKPSEPISNLALVGVYVLPPHIHRVIEDLKPSWRGELEITDAIQGLLEAGYPVFPHMVSGWWKDTGRPEDLLEANRLVLMGLEGRIQGTVKDSHITGAVVVEEGARIEESSIRGPVHIASGAIIRKSYVGPYTSIGKRSRIIGSEIEYSIILDDALVADLPLSVDASVIGQGAIVRGNQPSPRKHTMQLVLGDQCQVHL